jgi:hypothetical protein
VTSVGWSERIEKAAKAGTRSGWAGMGNVFCAFQPDTGEMVGLEARPETPTRLQIANYASFGPMYHCAESASYRRKVDALEVL